MHPKAVGGGAGPSGAHRVSDGRQLGGSNELVNGRQSRPIRTSLLSRRGFLRPPPLVQDYFSAAVKHFAELLTRVGIGEQLQQDVERSYVCCRERRRRPRRELAPAAAHRDSLRISFDDAQRRTLSSPGGRQLASGLNQGVSTHTPTTPIVPVFSLTLV